MAKRFRKLLPVMGIAALVALGVLVTQLPAIASALILHPFRRPVSSAPPPQCEAAIFQGAGIELKGWRGEAPGKFRGTMIYLHGVADNRMSGAGVMQRFQENGFDVIAYDNRAWRVRRGRVQLRFFREGGSPAGAGYREAGTGDSDRKFIGSGGVSSTRGG